MHPISPHCFVAYSPYGCQVLSPSSREVVWLSRLDAAKKVPVLTTDQSILEVCLRRRTETDLKSMQGELTSLKNARQGPCTSL